MRRILVFLGGWVEEVEIISRFYRLGVFLGFYLFEGLYFKRRVEEGVCRDLNLRIIERKFTGETRDLLARRLGFGGRCTRSSRRA